MEFILNAQQQFGLMALPLVICSLITLIIIIERCLHVILNFHIGRKQVGIQLTTIEPSDPDSVKTLAAQLSAKRALLFQGTGLLLRQQHSQKALREDIAQMWLQERRSQLNSGLKLLTLIGVISPLIGLLGTVLGLIDMFKGVAASTGNITPNDLADGLGLAMRTTAAGLIVALPAISAAQLFTLWSDRVIFRLEHGLNQVNLWIEGVDYSGLGFVSKRAQSKRASQTTTPWVNDL
ncbi:MotA/TolQ/ExbB proton channel family protein [Vibrio sp. S11_S32]|uniref:MotA/TolQ/ExbB proton channel family protein n=1 Tax=Vibrio sp. S11_S32 TaxID=2720225 RepID=UPI0016801C89|nr:MotA/TolQ/ExbB proton channel family protein [Vibrio sp. S11_S32]MBD1576624.1 MotA/TolQ/ExbB proton channel family protein [Vibrio sp. S11_S32]